jgi:hypothetical protein
MPSIYLVRCPQVTSLLVAHGREHDGSAKLPMLMRSGLRACAYATINQSHVLVG